MWEEAGKALLSSIVTEQSEAPEIERVNFVRFVDSAGVIVTQYVSGERVKPFRAYSSWAPEIPIICGVAQCKPEQIERGQQAPTGASINLWLQSCSIRHSEPIGYPPLVLARLRAQFKRGNAMAGMDHSKM